MDKIISESQNFRINIFRHKTKFNKKNKPKNWVDFGVEKFGFGIIWNLEISIIIK